MSLVLLWLLLNLVAGVRTTPAGPAPQQARDPTEPPTIGTAWIAGVVVDDEQPARPVRRAVVTLTGAGLHPNRGAITDDEGRFTIRGLPAGRFTLTAERGAFVTSAYGAKRPGRPGTAITVASGQQIANLQVRLWRGSVLTGVLRDASGAPLANTAVAAIASREVTSAALTLSNSAQAMTNDLGEYRLFGLEPGTYVVRAGSPQAGRAEVAGSEAEVDAKLAALAAARTRQPGATPRSTDRAETADALVSAAPIYFPGTPVAAEATPIVLGAGEERSGLDFTVDRIRIATIRGRVVGPDGAPIPRAFVQLSASADRVPFAGAVPAPVATAAGPDGAFELGPISPGAYRLLARGAVVPASGPGGGSVSGPFWWASVPVLVTGADVDFATLTLQPGMTFSGRVVFDRGAATPLPDPGGLRVQLQAESLATASRGRGGGPPGIRFLQPAPVHADGTFAVTDLVPDDYQLTVAGVASSGSRWWLRAAMSRGADLLDAPVRLAPGENVADVTLVLSDRHSELSGTLTTAGGAAVSDVFVLAFPGEPALRLPHSRRIRAVRPDSSGRFVFTDLPAGEYLLCALTDVDEGQWTDPGFLDSLAAVSVRIALGDGETKVQNLQAGG
jgi:Carboxypeptidase regulatory-like domain